MTWNFSDSDESLYCYNVANLKLLLFQLHSHITFSTSAPGKVTAWGERGYNKYLYGVYKSMQDPSSTVAIAFILYFIHLFEKTTLQTTCQRHGRLHNFGLMSVLSATRSVCTQARNMAGNPTAGMSQCLTGTGKMATTCIYRKHNEQVLENRISLQRAHDFFLT